MYRVNERASYRHAKETKHFYRHPVQQYHKSCTSQTAHKICVTETWVLCKVRQLYYLLNFSNFPKRTIWIENCASKKWSKQFTEQLQLSIKTLHDKLFFYSRKDIKWLQPFIFQTIYIWLMRLFLVRRLPWFEIDGQR